MGVSLLLVEYELTDDGKMYDGSSQLITSVYGSYELQDNLIMYGFTKEILIYEEIQNDIPFKILILDNQKLSECKKWLDQQYSLSMLEYNHGIINFKGGSLHYNEVLNGVDPECNNLWYKEIIELIDLKLNHYSSNDNVMIHIS